MQHIQISSISLGKYSSLSPEHWISTKLAQNMQDGTPLSDLIDISNQTAKPNGSKQLILDTGNAGNGLLQIDIGGSRSKKRVSAKKVLLEGDVVISRLRPYLRQVAYIPLGAFNLLNVEEAYCSTEFFVLRPKPNNNIAFLVSWLLSTNVQEMIGGAATGGHHPRFDKQLLDQANVPLKYQDKKLNEKIARITFDYLSNQVEMRSQLSSVI